LKLKTMVFLLVLSVFLVFQVSPINAATPLVSAVEVEGNDQVVSQHILSAVQTKPGEAFSEEQLKQDVERIYELGFFSFVDVKISSMAGGVAVLFLVQENPIVESIEFSGNTVYSSEELKELVFTAPGTVFNRVFFRHDLQRIKEKYEKDGYVMMKIADVQLEGGVIQVQIVEPVVGEIIIQGNSKTKTYVIEREIKIKPGDLFNATILRHSINKINNLGFFDDVSVGFEPSEEDPAATNLILTVEEGKTGNIGITIGHGSNSGWSGGLSYGDSNWGGKGHKFEVGFELGDNEQYWAYYQEPYMDTEHYAWKVGAYKRYYEDRDYFVEGESVLEYDEDRIGYYAGFGKKFPNDEKLSWYLTFDWRDFEYTNIEETGLGELTSDDIFGEGRLLQGSIFSAIATVTNTNLDPYLSYPKGDIEELNIEKALDFLGGDYDFTKYWLTLRYYTPLSLLDDLELFDSTFGNEDNPMILASRLRVGFSSGELPFAEQYEVGGSKTLRGYEDDQFQGDEMLIGNLELRLPVDRNFGFVVFYDIGNAWDTSAGESFSFSDLYDAYGFGIRVKTPLGNLRLDYGEGEFENRTHFGFGEMF